jgi:iron complex transport system ATP-binding protein
MNAPTAKPAGDAAPLACTDLGVRARGTALLAGVTLEARRGELLAVLGPNGAGKSTLIGALAGDLALASGSVRLGGDDLATLTHRERARRRAVLLQQNPIAFPFTVREVVAMGRAPWGDDAGVDAAIARLRLDGLAGRVVRTLSVGEQARVAMARVLAQDAPVMLLDEPTAVLDIGQQRSLMAIVHGLVAEGRAVVAVLHDLNLAMTHADRVLVLNGGAVVAEGSPRTVLTDAVLSDVYDQRVRVVEVPGHSSPLVTIDPSR